MQWNRVLTSGLDAAQLHELSARFREIAASVKVESFDLATGPGKPFHEDSSLLVLPLEINGKNAPAYLRELRSQGIGAPAVLLAPERILEQDIDLDELGVVDVVPQHQPTTFDLRRALAHLEAAQRSGARRAELEERIEEFQNLQVQQQHTIEQLGAQLTQLDMGDHVSGLRSETSMVQSVHQAFNLAKRHRTPVSCMVISIDDFDKIGQHFGAPFAAFVHDQIGHRLRESMRTTDVVSRYEEGRFLALTPHTPEPGATALANRLRDAVAGQRLERQARRLSLTLSIGISSYRSQMESSSELLENALVALGQARESGGNHYEVI
jgi:diguanylate cyclase (GGDEF)-like protein